MTDQALIDYLTTFITPERRARLDEILAQRTRHLTVVLEDLQLEHNASAVMRSCEAFGVQDIHVIEQGHEFNPNIFISMGTERWLTLHHYWDTASCFAQLRGQGYRILATSPHTSEISIRELPVKQPIALVFGNELRGISTLAQTQADGLVYIPMRGFCESFNLSVSTALCLYELTERLPQEQPHWQLSPAQQQELRLAWLRYTVKASAALERLFRKQRGTQP
ncbi:MAG: RNA methyltransferase [Cyanobacteria bacterium P01_G01_bin.54]